MVQGDGEIAIQHGRRHRLLGIDPLEVIRQAGDKIGNIRHVEMPFHDARIQPVGMGNRYLGRERDRGAEHPGVYGQ